MGGLSPDSLPNSVFIDCKIFDYQSVMTIILVALKSAVFRW
jgi:hypothetical protein